LHSLNPNAAAALTASQGILLLSAAVHSVTAAPANSLGMALLAATINEDGSLARGAGVTGTFRLQAGVYEVHFDRDAE
jgi:hypothetical protein